MPAFYTKLVTPKSIISVDGIKGS